MRPREPRLRDQDGAEIDMTTGERRSEPCAFEISGRWFSFSPGAVAYCGEPIDIPVTLGSILDSEDDA